MARIDYFPSIYEHAIVTTNRMACTTVEQSALHERCKRALALHVFEHRSVASEATRLKSAATAAA
jgi:hypothetical protein